MGETDALVKWNMLNIWKLNRAILDQLEWMVELWRTGEMRGLDVQRKEQ